MALSAICAVMPSARIYAQTLALSGLVIAVLVGCSLYLTDGHFTYAVDDAYIHLAIASLLPGQYGTTAGIPAAASSSLIYPWLLAPFADLVFAPLVLNLLALATSLWLLCRISAQLNLITLYPAWATAPIILLLGLAGNLYSMPLLGMEHSLHITAVLAVLSGLIDLNDKKPLPKWFWAALILMPMIRYEGFAMFGITLLWLLTTQYRMSALIVGGIEMGVHLIHAAYMHSSGLPMVAASILIKTGVNNIDTPIISILDRIRNNLIQPRSWILLIISALLLFAPGKHANRIVALAFICIIAHFIGGKIVWGDRYQSYLLAFSFIVLMYLLRPTIARIEFNAISRLLWLIVFVASYHSSFWTTLKTPYASQDIYLQQVQFTRLVRDFWQDPVGANDIGYLSWQSPYPIYDIYGLGSEEVRQLRVHGNRWDPAELDDYANRYNLSLFIIYDPWFTGQLPDSWVKVADFSFNRPHVNVAYNYVSLYLANPAEAERLEKALMAWQKTLPAGTTLIRHQYK